MMLRRLRFCVALAGLVLSAMVSVTYARESQPFMRIRDRAIDVDHDGVYEALEIEGDARLDSAGVYLMDPVLHRSSCDGSLVRAAGFGLRAFGVWRAGRWPTSDPAQSTLLGDGKTVTTDAKHEVHFVFRFDGEDLARLEQDGPWFFCPHFSVESPSARDTSWGAAQREYAEDQRGVMTGVWSYHRFGATPAYCGEVAWSIRPDRGIEMMVPLDVKRDARFGVRIAAAMDPFHADTTITTFRREGPDTLRVVLRLHDRNGQEPDTVTRDRLLLDVDGAPYLRCSWSDTWRYRPGNWGLD